MLRRASAIARAPRIAKSRGSKEIFKGYYGPVLKAFAALEPASQSALQRDLMALIGQFNRSGDGSMVVPSEYLEIVITRH